MQAFQNEKFLESEDFIMLMGLGFLAICGGIEGLFALSGVECIKKT